MAGLGLLALLGCAVFLPASSEDPVGIIAGWQGSRAGQDRAVLVQQDLETCTTENLAALQKAAYDFFLEEMKGFRAQSGERMAQAMHARAGATWSMICLSGSQIRSGQGSAAVKTVQEHLDRIEGAAPAEEVRAVWDRLALMARGAGLEELMLDALGHSLAMGSEDALQILGWEGLASGDWSGAGRLFAALLDRAESEGRDAAPWALPGWGLALLEGQSE